MIAPESAPELPGPGGRRRLAAATNAAACPPTVVEALSRQERLRRDYARRTPGWRDCLTAYRSLVRESITERCSVLDLGCGHADWLAPELEPAGLVVGGDADMAALRRNRSHGSLAAADAHHLPFASHSFDLVTCAWLLEHIERPSPVAAEVNRVLRTGGKFVFLTPNAWNYNVWLIRLVPNSLHDRLARVVYARGPGDTYPVRYRLNSPPVIDKTLTRAGLERVQLITNADPTYLGLTGLLYRTSCQVERLLEIGPLRSARVHLLGVYRKP